MLKISTTQPILRVVTDGRSNVIENLSDGVKAWQEYAADSCRTQAQREFAANVIAKLAS